jgi:hypothetical protein
VKIAENLGAEGRRQRSQHAAETRYNNSGRTTPPGLVYRRKQDNWQVSTLKSEYGFIKYIGLDKTLDEAIAILNAYRLTNPPNKLGLNCAP